MDHHHVVPLVVFSKKKLNGRKPSRLIGVCLFQYYTAVVTIRGRSYLPVVIQVVCLLLSGVIVIWVADLTAWFDRLTMLLIFSGMIIEFLCHRYSRGGNVFCFSQVLLLLSLLKSKTQR